MKFFVVLLAIFASANAAPQAIAGDSISNAIVLVIEGIQQQMPCGFPELGIPPLAPLKIPYKEVNIDLPNFTLHGAVKNFVLNGLNKFEIAEMNVNAIASKVSFRFIFNDINVETLYDLKLMLKKAGFTINMIGAGPAKFAIKDLDVWGSLKYSIGLTSGKMQIKALDIRAHIGEVDCDIEGILGDGVVNEKMNYVLAEAVEIAINDNEDLISETIEAVALPVVNSMLDEVTIAEIVAGSGGEGGEKEACIPPA